MEKVFEWKVFVIHIKTFIKVCQDNHLKNKLIYSAILKKLDTGNSKCCF